MCEHVNADARSVLSTELRLSNGVVLSNRLAKAATSEHLADRRGAPTRQLIRAYQQLAMSGVGLMISGNVMIDGAALEGARNVVIEDGRHLEQLRAWASVTDGTPVRFLLQLSHPGRQTMRGHSVAGRAHDVVSASAVPLTVGGRLFPAPRELTDAEVGIVIERFATAARVAAQAGFAGVELHAAHGYLISQFLSPLVNRRTDQWGGSIEHRMRFLLEIVRAVRAATPASFILAVKLNSADFQRGGFASDDALVVARALEREGVHLIELSGGTHESTAMVDGAPIRESTRAREAYFLTFAERFAREVTVPLMVSGGFRTRTAMIDAVCGGSVAVVGLARPIAHEPDFPRRILAGTTERSRAQIPSVGIKPVDDLLNSAWHQQQIARLGRGKPVRPNRRPTVALAIALLTNARDIIATRFPYSLSR
ncbi:NADH:flavin oxidoreductase/NADH oxidase family protein [Dactylosporangium sp. NPDC005572]|uniref:NADH:flavin oxidoreductase/NADH oxidase family protein n=1 Tax=Dactylosporangium sp. NPDC005572 TaxID=3156889 RepID=UPI0033B96685